jgi:C4-dicarboxylate-specific signal transduction histidine kinase
MAREADVHASESYQALGTLISGLERIANAGLQMAPGKTLAVADLDTVLDETRVVIGPSLREAGIALEWQAHASLPLVQADRHSLLQVFLNLARNAQQALEGRPGAELRVSAEMESDLVVVRFRDNGPGVVRPEELFRPFQPGAAKTGLGLYVSRAMVRSHGGGLRYEPQSQGSCFTVELWPVDNIGGEA